MPLKLSNEVQRQLEAINLENLASKLEALGVRSVQDLALVDDADLVRWGLSTIERRRFFGHVRIILGESSSDALTPPSALTTTPVPGRDKAAGARSRRPESTTSSAGPARLDELVGRGSAEYQVPRLAERLLASTGPIDISELALRISRTAPALAQGYAADEWPQFIEACVRGYKRLQVEDGVLEGDRAIVSICSTVLFTASEEVVADTVCWARIVTCLATPAQVAVVTTLCRASREVADGPQVWGKLLTRWYPKATLLNPDWVAQSDLEKRLEEALENDYALAALTKRLDPDTPWDIGDLLRALPQQTTPKALVKFMSGHPEHFRQSPDGKKFCVSRSPDDLRSCKDWRTVNPFQMPPMPKKLLDGEGDSSASARRGGGAPPAPSPYGRPKELKLQQAENAARPGGSVVDTPEVKQEVCQQLDPKVAFRLYHTGLLSQRSDHSKRGKLEVWEYYTESNSKCTMAASDLLDLAESRVRAIRSNDPAVVHELVCQTIEGMVFKVPFGFWHRRVRVLTMGLSASQLRIGREQRKKLERKLLEFMEWVKKERGFGYYQCDICKSRWKSGFSYEEITQQCLQCGNWQRPYRIQDLESAQEREAREKGLEDVPPEGRGPLPGKPTNSRFGHGGAVSMHMVPAVMFEAPILEHGREDWHAGQKRAWPGQPSQQPWQRPRLEGRSGNSGGDSWTQPFTPHVPRHVPPLRQAQEVPALAAAAPPSASSSASAGSGSSARYTPGGGGFFSRSGVAPGSAASSSSTRADAGTATSAESAATSVRYTPGAGGFFAQRSGSAGAQSSEDQRPRVDTAAVSRIVQHSIERPAAAASTAPAASSSASALTYKPGGGGFFASRQNTTPQASAPSLSGGSEETDEDGVFAKARDAANSLLASLGALLPAEAPPLASPASTESASAAKRGAILRNSKEAAAKAPVETASAAKSVAAASADTGHDSAADVAASLGLSVEEAQALGLLGSMQEKAAKPEASRTTSASPAVAPSPANPSPPAQAIPQTQPIDGTTTSYKPGGGGFFAQRRGLSSSSSSSSSAAAGAATTAVPAHGVGSTPPTANGASASGTGSGERSAPTEQPARYRPGGGGFFASRSASIASSAPGTSAEPGTAAVASAAASTPAATPSEGAASAASSPAPGRAAASYKPGGGGFFANRRGGGSSSSSHSEIHTGASSRSATEAAAASVAPLRSAEDPVSVSASAMAAAAHAVAAPAAKAASVLPEIEVSEVAPVAKMEAAASTKDSDLATAAAPVEEAVLTASEPPKMEPAVAAAAAAPAAPMAPAAVTPKTDNEVAGLSDKAAAAPSPATTIPEPVPSLADRSSAPVLAEVIEKPVAISAGYKPGEGGFFARKSSGAAHEASAAAPAAGEEAVSKELGQKEAQHAPAQAPVPVPAPAAATEGTPSASSTAAPAPSPPPLPADKLLALQTLGLTLDEAVKMGILPASYAEASPAPAAASNGQVANAPATSPVPAAAAAAAASSTSSVTQKSDEGVNNPGVDAEERAAKRRREDELAQEDILRQDEIRRREAAAKYAAARRAQSGEAAGGSGSSSTTATSAAETPGEAAGGSRSSSTAASSAAETPGEPSTASGARASDAAMAVDQEGEALSVDFAAISGGSDEALVEAVNAVVTFTGTGESAGSTKVIAAQASDVAYLLSDDVFWPLLRRLTAETLALEAGAADLEAAWVAAPASSEAAVQHAESRGYCLPGGSATAAVNSTWRHALLTEVATELMLLRLRVGRGFDLPALAGPVASDNSNWEERPAESLEGVASKVQGATGEGLAQNIIGDLERTTLRGAGVSTGKPLAERLAEVSDSILGQRSRWIVPADSTKNGPALRGKWTLLQEMSVREAAAALRREYGVRRHILLRRLDVTVEALRACDKMAQPTTQRKFSDILSRMWAGWRRSAAEAPPLSEWSALAAARGMLTRAMSARVSGPGARVSSAVKKVTIGHVPDRGGVPDGYVKDGGSGGQAASASSSAPAAKTTSQGQRPRLARTLRGGNAAADASSSSTAGQPGAAAQASDSAAERAPASVGVKPRDKKGDGKGGTQVGARSTNRELKNQHHAQLKKEREEGRSNTYYAELGQLRYGSQGE